MFSKLVRQRTKTMQVCLHRNKIKKPHRRQLRNSKPTPVRSQGNNLKSVLMIQNTVILKFKAPN